MNEESALPAIIEVTANECVWVETIFHIFAELFHLTIMVGPGTMVFLAFSVDILAQMVMEFFIFA